jgi:hypothetical protein
MNGIAAAPRVRPTPKATCPAWHNPLRAPNVSHPVCLPCTTFWMPCLLIIYIRRHSHYDGAIEWMLTDRGVEAALGKEGKRLRVQHALVYPELSQLTACGPDFQVT